MVIGGVDSLPEVGVGVVVVVVVVCLVVVVMGIVVLLVVEEAVGVELGLVVPSQGNSRHSQQFTLIS